MAQGCRRHHQSVQQDALTTSRKDTGSSNYTCWATGETARPGDVSPPSRITMKNETLTMTIPGYEGLYSATSDGRIISHPRLIGYGRGFMKPETEITQVPNRCGYPCSVLYKNGHALNKKVHALVCSAFHGNRPSPLSEVNHIDGNKRNNCASNLEWSTRSENMRHARESGLWTPNHGTQNGRSKLTQSDVLEIRNRRSSGEKPKEIAPVFRVSASTIRDICSGRAWKHLKPKQP